MTTCVWNQHQAQWALSLFRFQFVITYHHGHHQGKLDVFSHYLYFTPKEGDVTYE